MEFKLKDENETTKKKSVKLVFDDAGKEDDVAEMGGYVSNPVRISTTVTPPEPAKHTMDSDVFKIIKWVVLIAIVVVAAKFIIKRVNPEVTDVTGLVNKNTAEVEQTLDITLTKNSDMNTKINHYSNGKVTVDGNGEIGVVYIDGRYAGLHIDSKKYSMYGVKIGDGQMDAEGNMTFSYNDTMNVLEDMMQGNSTAVFYEGATKGDCLVVIYNDYSNRVAAVTYFKDYSKVTENLSSLDE